MTTFDFSALGAELVEEPPKKYAAFHEAGHVAAAIGLEMPVRYVTIEIPPNCAAQAAGITVLGEDTDDSGKKLVYYFAGVVAAWRYRTDKVEPDLAAILEEAALTSETDLQNIENEITLCELMGEDIPDFVDRTTQLINSHWIFVMRIAEKLFERGTLTGADVTRIHDELSN